MINKYYRIILYRYFGTFLFLSFFIKMINEYYYLWSLFVLPLATLNVYNWGFISIKNFKNLNSKDYLIEIEKYRKSLPSIIKLVPLYRNKEVKSYKNMSKSVQKRWKIRSIELLGYNIFEELDEK